MSPTARLRRAARMPPAELASRTGMAGRQLLERAQVRLRPPRWRRGDLARALDPALRPVIDRLRAGAWDEAHRLLIAHVRARPTPFLLTPTQRLRTAAQIASTHPEARSAAVTRARSILRREYDLLGYTAVAFGGAGGDIDWHVDPVSGRRAPRAFWADVPYLDPRCGDHKVIWELNRHQHWLALGRAWWLDGDRAFRAAFVDELESWLRANPPLVGINWASALEIGLRALSWLWALHFFADEPEQGEPAWTIDLLLGLVRQLTHLERHLSWYFSPNTHLLGEGLALYVCGSLLPELRAASRWRVAGRRVLLTEVSRQILADGAHAERSPHYHRYALDFYLLALAVARLADDRPTADALVPVVDRMATWMQRIADHRGRLPLIGDDDGGELFPIAGPQGNDARLSLGWAADLLDRPDLHIEPVPEALTWLTLHPRTRHARSAGIASRTDTVPAAAPVASEGSGYVLLRRGEAHLVMDAGPHGFLNAGHAHADALAITLVAAGEPFLIDPGTGTYTMDAARRDRFRSSVMHNTLVVDGRSQASPSGPFHWATTANARVERTVLTRAFDYVCGTTDAWTPLVHQRHVIAVGDDTWIVADEMLGSGSHDLTVHWHADPAWQGHQNGATVVFTRGGATDAHITVPDARVTLHHGDEQGGLGWAAPAYGRVVPTYTVRATVQGALPCWVATCISTDRAGSEHEVRRVASGASESPGASLALLHRRGAHTDVTLVRGSATQGSAALAVGAGGTLTTDARVLHARLDAAGRLVRLCAVDVTTIRLDGAGAFRFTAPRSIEDLFVRVVPGAAPQVESAGGTADLTVDIDIRRPAPALAARVTSS